MAICPCCRKSISDTSGPDELCRECSLALDAEVDPSPREYIRPEINVSYEPPHVHEEEAPPPITKWPRPPGVTLLALHFYLWAACQLLVAVGFLAGPRVTVPIVNALNPHRPELQTEFGIGFRFEYAGIFLASSLLMYLMGFGVWNTRNWGRRIMIVFAALELFGGGTSFAFWPVFELLPSGPVTDLMARFASFFVLWYLFRPRVQMAFGVAKPRWHWLYAISVLAVVSLGFSLYHSGPELKALRWHVHHGDRVTVNSVSFPVYLWQAPDESSDESRLEISDMPGSLRSRQAGSFLTIAGRREDENGHEEDRTLSPAELVDKKYESYEKSGYNNLRKFQMKVRGQTLDCVESILYTHTIHCYGEGPIFSIFFTGGDEPLDRFNQMIAEAR